MYVFVPSTERKFKTQKRERDIKQVLKKKSLVRNSFWDVGQLTMH